MTIEEIAKGIHYCIRNAKRFKEAAEFLEKKDIQSSYLLYLYSLEEMGKVVMVSNFIFYMDDPVKKKKWLRRFRNHEEKFWFSKDLDFLLTGRNPKMVNKDEQQKAKIKQEIAYVAFKERKFEMPIEISQKDLKEISSICNTRLNLLIENHSTIESDIQKLEYGLSLKDLSKEEIMELAKTVLTE